mmetsp:Transcript_59716/g.53769  ORF Transcript_59716/g.53769 Transcript_59716/m.53769 type:complete len:106 (-) Transcript_59716:80-397(-)
MGNSESSYGVYMKCRSCWENYYYCGSSTWNISGTVRRTRGYCQKCQNGDGWSITWEGSVVRIDCNGCGKTYDVIDWSDWSRKGDYHKTSNGYCTKCYDKKHKDKK